MNEGRKLTCPTCTAQVNIEGSCQSLKENLVYVNIENLLTVEYIENGLYDVAEIEHLINLVDEKKSGMQVKINRVERKYNDACTALGERKTQLEKVNRTTNQKVTTFFNDLKTRINEFLTRKENNVRDEVYKMLENEIDVNRQEQTWLDTMKTVLGEMCQFINGVKVSTGSKATVALDVFEEMDSHFDTFDKKLSKLNTADLELEFAPNEEEIQKIFDMEVAKVEASNTSQYRIGDNDTNVQDEQLTIDSVEALCSGFGSQYGIVICSHCYVRSDIPYGSPTRSRWVQSVVFRG
ncbi:hypothetical protein FSP39_003598 [Pinctada imbricata]|uniref:Uncharacterized protein n=1 Tax=Pinctada imbricata TaxID=66713 RepID=A0AA89BSH0_PINIB|nr:hypothetical protein FSP39_003598 [Pinctada imbricata]